MRLAVAPPLKQHPSVSSLSVFSSGARAGASPVPPGAATAGTSTPSSGVVVDPQAGILIAEGSGEVEEDEVDVAGRIEQPEGDEDAKRTLREQLRQTLLPRGASTGKLISFAVWRN